MFVPKTSLLIFRFVRLLVDLFKDIFETPIITLQDGVFSAHVERIPSVESVLEASMGEPLDRLIGVVHAHEDARAFEFVDFDVSLWSSRIWLESHGEFSRFSWDQILSPILVTESVSTNYDRFSPSWD